jgi:hypothetical protein
VNLWSVLHDREHWGDPEVFRPERFLDADGRFIKDEFIVQFGAGKRVCFGETLDRNMLFLIFSTLMQEFIFKIPDVATTVARKDSGDVATTVARQDSGDVATTVARTDSGYVATTVARKDSGDVATTAARKDSGDVATTVERIFGISCLLCTTFIYYFLPETQGKSLMEIEDDNKTNDVLWNSRKILQNRSVNT